MHVLLNVTVVKLQKLAVYDGDTMSVF